MEEEALYPPDYSDLDLSFTSCSTTTTDRTTISARSSLARSSLTLSFNESRLSSTSAPSSSSSSTCIPNLHRRPHRRHDSNWAAIKAATTLSSDGALHLRHLKLLRLLGSGNLGRVFLCRLRDYDHASFALKVVDRDSLTSKKLSHVQTEAEILSSLDHPFLPTLYAHLEVSHYTCLLIDYCPNGDLHSLLRKQPRQRFDVDAVRFYAAEVLVALEYLHALGIVYRDLKPENILIREDGHIMLSDFDLCFKSDVSPRLENKLTHIQIGSRKYYSTRSCLGGCSCDGNNDGYSRQDQTVTAEFVAEPTSAFSRSCVGTHEYLAPELVGGSRFIECMSLACICVTEKIKRSLLDTINENLRHPNSHIQSAAVDALKYFTHAYLMGMDDKSINEMLLKYIQQLSDANVAARRGSALALGVLPIDFLAKQWKIVLSKLCTSCAIEDNPEDRDAEVRVNAVKGLVSVCEILTKTTEFSKFIPGENSSSIFLFIKNEVMQCLFKALEDYSVDNRGDVGSWVREAAIIGLEKCTYILCQRGSLSSEQGLDEIQSSELHKKETTEDSQVQLYFDETLAINLIGGLVKQAVEKMDKIRELAAKVIQRILYNETIFIPFLAFREKLEKLIPNNADSEWGEPTFSYHRFVQLLQCSCYSKHLASGLVISIGGLQDSLRKASLSALLDYVQMTEAEDREFCLSSDILWVLQNYKRCDRVVIPTLKTIEILFSKKVFLKMEVHTRAFCAGILNSLSIELKGSKDFSKLYSGIAILGYIASLLDPVNVQAFAHLLTFLGHRYPKIRKATAEQVYLVLLENGSLVAEDKKDKALENILETCWEGDLHEAKSKKLELCNILGLEGGQIQKVHSSSTRDSELGSITHDENALYSSLVESAGF